LYAIPFIREIGNPTAEDSNAIQMIKLPNTEVDRNGSRTNTLCNGTARRKDAKTNDINCFSTFHSTPWPLPILIPTPGVPRRLYAFTDINNDVMIIYCGERLPGKKIGQENDSKAHERCGCDNMYDIPQGMRWSKLIR